jgi:hypothetical protein
LTAALRPQSVMHHAWLSTRGIKILKLTPQS